MVDRRVRRRFQLFLAIYAIAHVYIWWRLIWPEPSPYWQLATALELTLGGAFPFIMRYVRFRRVPRASAKRWLLIGYLWFGLAAYLLMGAIGSHVAVAFGADARLAAQVGTIGAAVIVVLGLLNVARGPLVTHVRVPIPKLSVERYTIVHLTDVHVGTMIGRKLVEDMVARANAVEPDLVAITGDLIDGHLSDLAPDIEPLRDLRARDGVFAVTGNHEFYWKPEPWLAHLRTLGVRILRNEHVALPALELAGTDDMVGKEDLPRALAGRDASLPLVLLAHRPRTVLQAMHSGVDLQLSGHTHGGQLLPWGWLARLWDPVVGGLVRFGSTWLYVSDGTGYWGPPLRVGTRCEIAAITLVRE